MLKAGSGDLGMLPAASLPLIAAVLSAFYELDNTPSGDKKDDSKSDDGEKASGKKVRVAKEEEATEEEDEAEPASEKKKKR
jgi:hypothetical protein